MVHTRVALLALLLGCKGTDEMGADMAGTDPADLATIDGQVQGDLSTPPDLASAAGPIVAPMKTWTWVDVAGTTCNEGTSTGVGVYLTGSKNVFVYLFGGGACADYRSCFVDKTATTGPVGKAQFDQLMLSPPPIPFNDYNWIMVPYCTGDLHGGDNAPTYMADGKSEVFRHKGYANMKANLQRLKATFPKVDKLILAGSSAGGFGTLLNYDQTRTALAPDKAYVFDDSGPPLLRDDIPQPLYSAWKTSWKLDTTVGPLCSGCADDLSKSLTEYAKKYPKDRVAVVAFLQDGVLRRYLGNKSAADMQAATLRLAPVIEPLANTRYYFIPTDGHVVFGNLAAHTVKGVNLATWLVQMINDDPNWKSVKP